MNKSQSSLIFKSGLVLLGLISFFFAILYFINPKTIEREKIEYKLLNVDSSFIVAKAREGWIPQDSLKELLLKNKKIIKIFDVDTIVLRDTVVLKEDKVTKTKFYENDWLFNFTKEDTLEKWELDALVDVKTRFYPNYKIFSAEAELSKINIKIEYPKQKQGFQYWTFTKGLVAGFLGKAAFDELTK